MRLTVNAPDTELSDRIAAIFERYRSGIRVTILRSVVGPENQPRWAYASLIPGDSGQDWEDIYQQALLQALSFARAHGETLDLPDDEAMKNWVFRIVLNLLNDITRNRRRFVSYQVGHRQEVSFEVEQDLQDIPGDRLVDTRLIQSFRNLVETFTPDQRCALASMLEAGSLSVPGEIHIKYFPHLRYQTRRRRIKQLREILLKWAETVR